MYAPGHAGLALLAYTPVGVAAVRRGRARPAVAGLLLVVALATLPDADRYVPWLAHRGFTHTVWFALGVGTLVGAAVRAWEGVAPAVRAGALAVLTLLVHLVGDVVTPMGLRPLAPLSDAHYTLSLVKSRTPWANRALFGAGAGVVAVGLGPALDADLTAGRFPEQAVRYATADGSAAGRRPSLRRGPAGTPA